MRAQRVSLLALGCLSRICAPRPAEFNIGQRVKNNKPKSLYSFARQHHFLFLIMLPARHAPKRGGAAVNKILKY